MNILGSDRAFAAEPKMATISCPLSLSFILTLLITISKSSSAPTYFYSICPKTTMFTPNSKYHTNLNTVFRSLSFNATNPTGFYTTSAGNTTGTAVYGSFFCRGDLTVAACQDCVSTATNTDLPMTYCPNRKVALIWYDECMVRYSNESFIGKMETSPYVCGWNQQNVTGNLTRFSETLGSLMDGVVEQASIDNQSGKKFAINATSFTSLETLYGLAQCIPVLTFSDCDQCLRIAVPELPISRGGRVLQPSCFVRYESYPFFNGASDLLSTPPKPSLPVTNSTNEIIPGNNRASTRVIVAIVAPVAVVGVALLALGICIIVKKKIKKYVVVAVETGEDFSTVESLQYDLATLQIATHNFSDENRLGEGGFGVVYKGTITNGQEIAVKKLSMSSTQGMQEFKNEVLLVAKLQHRNLVRLLGFCFTGEERLLVYEYVPNKSLDYFIFVPENQGQLDWGRRYKIIQGIARGILYLHQDSRLTIIHRDLKASNILLDMNMNPKISDFGMAKIFGVDQTQGNTSRIVGTYGYLAPEYAMQGHFSIKSDVYSFGVLVLEIISGMRNSSFYQSGIAEDLLSYAWKQWKDGIPMDFVDPAIRDTCSSHEVMRCIHMGLLCVQESVNERPTMATLVLMLDSYSVTLPVPEQPAFAINSRTESNLLKEIGSDHQSSSNSTPWSVNDVTVTEPEPR